MRVPLGIVVPDEGGSHTFIEDTKLLGLEVATGPSLRRTSPDIPTAGALPSLRSPRAERRSLAVTRSNRPPTPPCGRLRSRALSTTASFCSGLARSRTSRPSSPEPAANSARLDLVSTTASALPDGEARITPWKRADTYPGMSLGGPAARASPPPSSPNAARKKNPSISGGSHRFPNLSCQEKTLPHVGVTGRVARGPAACHSVPPIRAQIAASRNRDSPPQGLAGHRCMVHERVGNFEVQGGHRIERFVEQDLRGRRWWSTDSA